MKKFYVPKLGSCQRNLESVGIFMEERGGNASGEQCGWPRSLEGH